MNDWKQPCAPPNGSTGKRNSGWLAGRITTLLSHYYTPDIPATLSEAAMVDWLAVLDGLPTDDIERACMDYLREEPRRRPTPGDIRQRVLAKRAWAEKYRAPVVQIDAPSRERVTPEAANAILAEAGFRPRRMVQE